MGLAQQARMDALAVKELHERSFSVTTLPELVVRAINAQAALTMATNLNASDADWTRCETAAFDARADLRAALMNMGLTKSLIDQLGEIV